MIDIKYKNMYDTFIKHYKTIHVNPWHEIKEEQLQAIYHDLTSSMDIKDEYSFKYFMDYIIKRLSGNEDAHTQYQATSLLPLNFKIFEDEVIVNYPASLKNSTLISINNIKIETILNELEEVITYGTKGKRRYELEKSLFNKYILFSIPSLRNFDSFVFEMKLNGKTIFKEINKEDKYKEELFDYNEYLYGNPGFYQFNNNVLIYNHSSIQNIFKEKIEKSIMKLKLENLSNIDTIIIDIRGNTGGNSCLNKMLMDFIRENRDKKLICLTDYRVFSGGRYALRDLISLGATTIGEEISTPINCYGNSNWINIDNHYFSVSECYFHPFLNWSVSSKEAFKKESNKQRLTPYIFQPDILVKQTKEDYIENIDTILNYAIQYSQNKTK